MGILLFTIILFSSISLFCGIVEGLLGEGLAKIPSMVFNYLILTVGAFFFIFAPLDMFYFNTGTFFGFVSIFFQVGTVILLFKEFFKKKVSLEYNEGLVLVEKPFKNEHLTCNNLALISLIYSYISSINLDGSNVILDNLISFNSYPRIRMLASLTFVLVYITTFLLQLRIKKERNEILRTIKADNEYLTSNVYSIFTNWRKNIGKEFFPHGFKKVVRDFNIEDAEVNVKLTNTEAYKESSTLLEVVEKLQKAVENEFTKELARNLYLNTDFNNYKNESMRALSENISKGFKAEEIMTKKIGHLEGFLNGRTFEKDGYTVELDGIIVNDNGIYLIEVKNYSADEIVFESSGIAYRKKGHYTDEIEILGQVERARRIVKDIVNEKVNIYNVIVFADPETKITNNIDNPNIKIVHMNLLSFLFENQTNNNPLNKKIIDQLLKSESRERKYDFYDVHKVKKDFKEAIDNDIVRLNNILNIMNDFSLMVRDIENLKLEIQKAVSNYNFKDYISKDIINRLEINLDNALIDLRNNFNPSTKNQVEIIIKQFEFIKNSLK